MCNTPKKIMQPIALAFDVWQFDKNNVPLCLAKIGGALG